MPARNWTAFFRPVAATPTAFRLVFAALSATALSLSYTGFYLSVYSWICVGVLLIVIFGARPPIAFVCGALHGFFFVITSLPWCAAVVAVAGGLSTPGGWGVLLLIAIAWGVLTGSFAWVVQRLWRHSIALACVGAPFVWVTFEFARAHLPEISFPWNLLGYPASGNLALLQITTLTGIYGLSFLVAAFNALLAWCDAAVTQPPVRRVAILGCGTALILIAMLVGPQFVPVS